MEPSDTLTAASDISGVHAGGRTQPPVEAARRPVKTPDDGEVCRTGVNLDCVAEAPKEVEPARLDSAEEEEAADAEGRSTGMGLVPIAETRVRLGCGPSLARSIGWAVPMLLCDLVVLLLLIASRALDGAGCDADTDRTGGVWGVPSREAESGTVGMSDGTGDNKAAARRSEARAAEANVGAVAMGLPSVPPAAAVAAATAAEVSTAAGTVGTVTTSSESESRRTDEGEVLTGGKLLRA